MRPTEQVLALEAKYADRGLRFDRGHEGRVAGMGSVPVQAFGRLDGQRFYFRFRGDCAQLRIGPFDQALEDAVWERGEQVRLVRLAKLEESGDKFNDDGSLSMSWLLNDRPERKPAADDHGFSPRRVTASSIAEKVFNDPYLGSLTDEQFQDLFTGLADNLTVRPAGEQVDTLTIRYLTEGGLWPLPATV